MTVNTIQSQQPVVLMSNTSTDHDLLHMPNVRLDLLHHTVGRGMYANVLHLANTKLGVMGMLGCNILILENSSIDCARLYVADRVILSNSSLNCRSDGIVQTLHTDVQSVISQQVTCIDTGEPIADHERLIISQSYGPNQVSGIPELSPREICTYEGMCSRASFKLRNEYCRSHTVGL